MSTPKLLILADDLTGANDAGVQFAKNGISSFVHISPDFATLATDFEVVVVNTESRHAPAIQARRLVQAITARALRAGIPFFYKKTDSTLRGNIGIELETLMHTLQLPALGFVPAFPAQGRTTRHGIHFVHGLPIAESPFGRDPLNPISQSHIPSFLSCQTALPIHLISSTPSHPPAAGIWVFDCESQPAMSDIARFLFSLGHMAFAGSADFVQHLAPHLQFRISPPLFTTVQVPILLVNGSLHERSLEQVRAAPTSLKQVQIPSAFYNSTSDPSSEIAWCQEWAAQKVDLLLHTVLHGKDVPTPDHVRSTSHVQSTIHDRVAATSGRLVKNLLASGYFKTLVVFGGDTLAAISRECQWTGFIPVSEIAPGITVARPSGYSLTVISKAGGFGSPDIIRHIVSFVSNNAS